MQDLRQRNFRGFHQKVNVVGHKAVGEKHVRILVARIVKQMEEFREVHRLSEKKTAIIAFGHDVI